MLDFILRLLPGLSDAALDRLDAAIELERARRAACEHGLRAGDWRPDCREEYRRGRAVEEGEE